MTIVFADAYATAAGEQGYPQYLQEAGQAALRRLDTSERLLLHVGNMIVDMTTLAAASGGFDLIIISNIPDWMNAEQFAEVAAKACPAWAMPSSLMSWRSIYKLMCNSMQS